MAGASTPREGQAVRGPPGDDTMSSADLFLTAVAILAVVSTLVGTACVYWVTRRRPLPDFTPPVTIYKPLKGCDEGLEENLRSFFQLDYPTTQLLFGIAQADDPAAPIVRRLLEEFPPRRRPPGRRQPDVRPEPEGREPSRPGAVPPARRHPHQRFQRPRPPRVPPRNLLLPGRSPRRSRHEPLRRRRGGAFGGDPGEPPAQRLRRRRSGAGERGSGRLAWSASRC